MDSEEMGYAVGWRDAKKGSFGDSVNPFDPVENTQEFEAWADGYALGFFSGEAHD